MRAGWLILKNAKKTTFDFYIRSTFKDQTQGCRLIAEYYISSKNIISWEDVGTGYESVPSLDVTSLQIYSPTSRYLAKIDCLLC